MIADKPPALAEPITTARFSPRLLDIAIVLIALLAIAGLWVETIYRARDNREQAVRMAMRANANLARTFEAHTERTLNDVDQILLLAKREYEHKGKQFDLAGFFAAAQLDRDLFLNIVIMNERGDSILSSEQTRVSVNIADREHFRVHQAFDSGRPFIGKPLVARMAKQQAMIVTRRINKADGAFGGVAAVAISPRYFPRLYETVDLGTGSVVGLVGLDGIMRARRAGSNTEFGQDINGTEMMRRIASEPQGNFVARARSDDVMRVFSYRALKKYPLAVTVGMAESVAVADAVSAAQHAQRTALLVTLLIVLSTGLLLWLTRHQRAAAQALRARELQLRALLDGIPGRVWFRDTQGRYVAINRAEQQHYGLPEAQIVGKRLHELVPKAKADLYLASDAAVTAASGSQIYERYLADDKRWNEVVKGPVLDADGNLAGSVGILIDVTQRMRMESELFKASVALENAVEGIAHLSQDGKFISVNAAYANVAGFAVAEMIGQSWRTTVHPEDVPLVEAMCQRMVDSGKGETEVRGVRRDGSVYYKSVVLVRAWEADQGDQPDHAEQVGGGFCCFVKDISERMRITTALRDSEQRLRALLDGIPDRVWLKDRDSRFVALNRSYEAACKKPMVEIIGTRGLANIPQHHIAGMLAEDRSVMETRTPLRYERKSVFEDSWQDVIKAPIVAEDGTVIGVVGISRDITERKQLFEQLREAKTSAESANRAKSEFLAAMSHDIRTPMTGVLGMAEVLAETPLSSEQQQHLDTMRSSGESMLEIIDSILNFAKVEAGKMEPRPVAFDPAALVRQSAELFRARAAVNGVALRCHTDAPARCRLIGDSALIGRTLTNLVGNAVKFTEYGEISVVLTIASSATAGHATAQFEVCDSGIGISAEDRGRLFRPFTQADRSTRRRFGGTGLGLALSKNMVELLGGDLRVDSTLGKGSRFYFTLDLALAPATTSAETAAANALPQELPLLQGCVLLAEDHPVNRKVLERMLKKYAIEVRHAVDGNEALARWREGGIDLIFMDCHMPDMDGYEATAAIRRDESAGNMQHTPIIALTANALVGDARVCLEAGMDGYTSKPVRLGRMTRLLMRYLALQGGGVPARLWRTDLDTVESLADKGLLYGTVERLAQNAPAQLDALREQLQAGQVSAALETMANLREATLRTGAPLLTMLLGEIQSATASGGLEDARAALPELEAMLHVTLAELQGAARKVA